MSSLLFSMLSIFAYAECGAFLTRAELLKVDGPITREIRRFAPDEVYLRLNWYDSIRGHELAYAFGMADLLREKGQTPPTHAALPLIPPPVDRARLVRVMVRTPGRAIPAMLNAELWRRPDGHYAFRVKLAPAWREGEADVARAEEVIAVYTLLAAAPYVSRISFRMELRALEHTDFTMALHRAVEERVPVDEAVCLFMDAATDLVLARPPVFCRSRFALRGYVGTEERELKDAQDFIVEREYQLDDHLVEPLTSEGRRLN